MTRRLEIDRATGRGWWSGIRPHRVVLAVVWALLAVTMIVYLTQACRSSLALRVERLERIHVLEQRGRELREEMSRRLLEAEPRHAL